MKHLWQRYFLSRWLPNLILFLKGYRVRKNLKCSDMKCTLSVNPLLETWSSREKGIYGKDDKRLAISEEFLQNIEKSKNHQDIIFAQQARAACVLVFAPRLKKEGQVYKLKTKLYHVENDLCESEKFYDNPVLGYCSGFTFEKDNNWYVCAAGHCYKDMKASQIAFVYDFRQDKGGYFPSSIPQDKVIFPENTPTPFSYSFTQDAQDYVIFKCATKPPYYIPFSMLDSTGLTKKDDEMCMIGHPCGLPAISDVGKVLDDPQKTFFRTNLSAYHGNSGSMIIQKNTGMVVGILVRGDKDFVPSTKENCYKSSFCAEDGSQCRGEDVVRMDYIIKASFGHHKEPIHEEKEKGEEKITVAQKSLWRPPKCSSCA